MQSKMRTALEAMYLVGLGSGCDMDGDGIEAMRLAKEALGAPDSELLEACEMALAYIVATRPLRLDAYPGIAPFDPCQMLRERISKAYCGDPFGYIRRPELAHLQEGL